ncbi:MAG: prephenate dehydrogenase/arogenate dehydrogenase family protein [Candidatus Saccharibacteria bacterium]|jgi:prephenate dehydrogenase
MKTLGIIGYGSFGKFAAEQLASYFSISIYDPNKPVPPQYSANLDVVCRADYVILAIPLAAYHKLFDQIISMLGQASVVVDIASVKVEPIKLIKAKLNPRQPYLATHPLFGPESASHSLNGFKLVVCESNLPTEQIYLVKNFCKNLGLDLVELSADDHDQQMATVQALTFFLARTLNEFGLHDMQFQTPSFQRLLDLADLDKKHSTELLQTIWSGNKYSATVRKKFINEMIKLDNEIK